MVKALITISMLTLSLPGFGFQDVVNTVHNLSISGPGIIKSGTVDKVCVFCHTPHNANPSVPLWNHQLPNGQIYLPYNSSSLQAQMGQPTGTSQLCLGCHDGTVALGLTTNPPNDQIMDLDSQYLQGRALLSTDLSDDHPISFIYDSALATADSQLNNPVNIDLPLDANQLQCTSCHDPHEKDLIPFLRKSTKNGELCLVCHAIGQNLSASWATASHATSTATSMGGNNNNPWSERKSAWQGNSVAENACFNCHAPHNASMKHGLIKAQEENTCYLCHDGHVAARNIQSEFTKIYRHPISLYTGIHDPTEDFTNNPADHVECQDCHNPHFANNSMATPPDIPGALSGVTGVTASGIQVPEATYLYEVCYKCHADNNIDSISPMVQRQHAQKNTRREFDLGNPSFHPVQGVGQNPNVPSLISPLNENSVIYCTDCHNNDTGPNNSGSGPNGPHGSIFSPILERNYTTADFTSESAFAYALCYKCHDRNSILNNESFSEHRKHIVEERSPCSACHDAHGISLNQGNPTNNSHLINFDISIVSPSGGMQGQLRFEDLGVFRGRCFLQCHGQNHSPENYP